MIFFLFVAVLNGIHGKELCLNGNCAEMNNLPRNSWHDLNENEHETYLLSLMKHQENLFDFDDLYAQQISYQPSP